MPSTYSSVIIIFVLTIALLETHLNRHVIAAIYHHTLTSSISVIGFITLFAFKMTVNNLSKLLPGAVLIEVVPDIIGTSLSRMTKQCHFEACK